MDEKFEQNRTSQPGRTIIVIVIVFVAALIIAFASGLLDIDSTGNIETPTVSVEGGEMPDIDIDAAEVNVGTRTETIEVPTVSVSPADAETEQ